MLQKFIFSANRGYTAVIIYQAGVTEFKCIGTQIKLLSLGTRRAGKKPQLVEICLRVLNLVQVLHSWAYKDIHFKLRLSKGKLLFHH